MTNKQFNNKIKSDRVMFYQTLLGKHSKIFDKLTEEEKFDLYKSFLFEPVIWQQDYPFKKELLLK